MSPLLPQGLVGGTSYDGLKGEARSKRFVRGVCFYELCLAKGQDILPVSRKGFFKRSSQRRTFRRFIPEFINKVQFPAKTFLLSVCTVL